MHMKYIDHLARWFRTTQAAAQGTTGYQEVIGSLQQEQSWIAHCSLVMSILESNDYFKHELCLHRYGYKVYSQNEDDGLLRRIFAGKKVSGTVKLLLGPPVGTKRHFPAGQETVSATFGALISTKFASASCSSCLFQSRRGKTRSPDASL